MRPAFAKDDALLASIEAAPSDPGMFTAWWLGQSGFLIQWNGEHLLFDPYLSDSLTRKYAATDKEHVRMTEQVIAPEKLGMVDVATSSHVHTDHLDAETLHGLLSANPNLKLVLPEANFEFATERLGDKRPEFVALDDGAVTDAGAFKFRGIPASHNTVERDDHGRCRFLCFIVEFGPFRVFHSGDTLWHFGLHAAVEPHAPFDLMFLPINGYLPERRVAGNMNASQAAAFGKLCRARMVVPHHFWMFEFNTVEPDEFVACCQKLDQPFTVLENGQSLEMQAKSS